MRSRTRFPASVARSSWCVKKTRPKLEKLLRRTVNCRPSMTTPPISISLDERQIPQRRVLPRLPPRRLVPAFRGGRGKPPSLHKSVDERYVRSHGLAVQIKADCALLVGAVSCHLGLV